MTSISALRTPKQKLYGCIAEFCNPLYLSEQARAIEVNGTEGLVWNA